jgi:formyltetrahydrofolate deformylase
MSSREHYILTLNCPDARGIVAAVTTFLSENYANIIEAEQFSDIEHSQFYMRVAFRPDGGMPDLAALTRAFSSVVERFQMRADFHDTRIKPRVMIAVSKIPHCLSDLLSRWRSGLLPIDIAGVVSNHNDMRSFVEWHGVPYFYMPVTAETKFEQERVFANLIDDRKIDLVVLARYMQVLSPALCKKLAGKCINIHHSFLPSFKGAKPYHQAHARGVKLIGATAHYVTSDLDEGPIIAQDVESITHRDSAEDLVRKGRDIERRVLARAVRYHLEDRILLNGRKTVVFAD